MNTALYTIGYEGLKTEDFISRLKQNDIDVLVDVREIPLSRKKGFSKTQLGTMVNEQDIKYVHIGKLGSPSIIRKKVKETNDYNLFFKEYSNYLKTVKNEIDELMKLMENNRCCIMCFEKEVEKCHRKIVAEKVKILDGNSLKVINL